MLPERDSNKEKGGWSPNSPRYHLLTLHVVGCSTASQRPCLPAFLNKDKCICIWKQHTASNPLLGNSFHLSSCRCSSHPDGLFWWKIVHMNVRCAGMRDSPLWRDWKWIRLCTSLKGSEQRNSYKLIRFRVIGIRIICRTTPTVSIIKLQPNKRTRGWLILLCWTPAG